MIESNGMYPHDKHERALELKRLRGIVQANGLRVDSRERRKILGEIVPLLNFNDTYHINAQQFADILSRDGLSSSMYESCEGRLDVIMGQAITELEQNLTPPPPPPPGLVPTPNLTDEHGLWWFVQHCTVKTRRWMIISAVVILGIIIPASYFAGHNHFINQFIELWRQSSNPFSQFRDVARLQRKLTAISALTALRENRHFARIAQNYAVRVSEIVRKKEFLPTR